MAITLDRNYVGNSICESCGRLGFHCFACGLSNCYALLKSNRVELVGEDKQPVHVVTYRCRSCGTSFDLLNKCAAPQPKPIRKSIQQQRLEANAANSVANLATKTPLNEERLKALGLDKYLKGKEPS